MEMRAPRIPTSPKVETKTRTEHGSEVAQQESEDGEGKRSLQLTQQTRAFLDEIGLAATAVVEEQTRERKGRGTERGVAALQGNRKEEAMARVAG
jgi:hypothetical protein